MSIHQLASAHQRACYELGMQLGAPGGVRYGQASCVADVGLLLGGPESGAEPPLLDVARLCLDEEGAMAIVRQGRDGDVSAARQGMAIEDGMGAGTGAEESELPQGGSLEAVPVRAEVSLPPSLHGEAGPSPEAHELEAVVAVAAVAAVAAPVAAAVDSHVLNDGGLLLPPPAATPAPSSSVGLRLISQGEEQEGQEQEQEEGQEDEDEQEQEEGQEGQEDETEFVHAHAEAAGRRVHVESRAHDDGALLALEGEGGAPLAMASELQGEAERAGGREGGEAALAVLLEGAEAGAVAVAVSAGEGRPAVEYADRGAVAVEELAAPDTARCEHAEGTFDPFPAFNPDFEAATATADAASGPLAVPSGTLGPTPAAGLLDSGSRTQGTNSDSNLTPASMEGPEAGGVNLGAGAVPGLEQPATARPPPLRPSLDLISRIASQLQASQRGREEPRGSSSSRPSSLRPPSTPLALTPGKQGARRMGPRPH